MNYSFKYCEQWTWYLIKFVMKIMGHYSNRKLLLDSNIFQYAVLDGTDFDYVKYS
jgi:hypothetical protein